MRFSKTEKVTSSTSEGWKFSNLDRSYYYVAILIGVIFSKLRNINQFRDLEAGDTSSYFVNQLKWFQTLRINPIWSPLDSILGGTLQILTSNAYTINLCVRIITITTISILIFLIFSRILTKEISLLLSIFFTINPIYFDAMYQIHIESLVMAFCGILLYFLSKNDKNFWLAISIILSSGLLARNEYLLLGISIVLITAFLKRRSREKNLFSYQNFRNSRGIVSLSILISTMVFLVARSSVSFHESKILLSRKNSLNFCQVYADYALRFEKSWTGNQWTECQTLMQKIFNHTEPTIFVAFFNNPIAVCKMILVHIFLIFSSLELLLTGKYSGLGNPDYINHPVNHWLFIMTTPLIYMGISGFIIILRNYEIKTIHPSIAIRVKVLIISVFLFTLAVSIGNPPRPEYLYFLSLVFLLGIGIWLQEVLIPKVKVSNKVLIISGVTVLVINIFNPFYNSSYQNALTGLGQPLRSDYERIIQIIESDNLVGKPIAIYSKRGFGELCSYIFDTNPKCVSLLLSEYSNEIGNYLRVRI